jgi:hypothetical protein
MFQRKGRRYLPGLTIHNVVSAVLQLGQVIEHLGDMHGDSWTHSGAITGWQTRCSGKANYQRVNRALHSKSTPAPLHQLERQCSACSQWKAWRNKLSNAMSKTRGAADRCHSSKD